MRELDKALAAGLVKTDNHTRGYLVENEDDVFVEAIISLNDGDMRTIIYQLYKQNKELKGIVLKVVKNSIKVRKRNAGRKKTKEVINFEERKVKDFIRHIKSFEKREKKKYSWYEFIKFCGLSSGTPFERTRFYELRKKLLREN
jgi:DNA polymerase III delta prime subunit